MPAAERVDVSKSTIAYARLMEQLWLEGETFLVIEHDVELTPEALRQAIECECEWSTSPYAGLLGTLYFNALGCTRFRASIMADVPDAMEIAMRDRSFGIDPHHFSTMDARLFAALRDAGKLPHVHDEVPHHHTYGYGCACGEEHP